MHEPSLDKVSRLRERRRLRAPVAEDDAGLRRLLAVLLAEVGWEVRFASDGEEAVERAQDRWPADARGRQP